MAGAALEAAFTEKAQASLLSLLLNKYTGGRVSWSLGGHHPALSQGAHPWKFQFYAYFVRILDVIAEGLLEIKGSRPHLVPRYRHPTIATGGRGLGMCHVRNIKWTTLIIISVPFSGIKYIHIVVQPSPPSISRTLFIFLNQTLSPLKNNSILFYPQPPVTTVPRSVSMNLTV